MEDWFCRMHNLERAVEEVREAAGLCVVMQGKKRPQGCCCAVDIATEAKKESSMNYYSGAGFKVRPRACRAAFHLTSSSFWLHRGLHPVRGKLVNEGHCREVIKLWEGLKGHG